MNLKPLDSLCAFGSCSKRTKILKIAEKDRESSEQPHVLSWNFLENENLSLVCADLHNHQARVTKLREVTEYGT